MDLYQNNPNANELRQHQMLGADKTQKKKDSMKQGRGCVYSVGCMYQIVLSANEDTTAQPWANSKARNCLEAIDPVIASVNQCHAASVVQKGKRRIQVPFVATPLCCPPDSHILCSLRAYLHAVPGIRSLHRLRSDGEGPGMSPLRPWQGRLLRKGGRERRRRLRSWRDADSDD